MTLEDRNNKLKHFIACIKCEISGKECDTNCPTQYEAWTIGELVENLEAISKLLEQEPNNDEIRCQIAGHDKDGSCLGYSDDSGDEYCDKCKRCPEASINKQVCGIKIQEVEDDT